MARRGLAAHAWDISKTVIDALRRQAAAEHLEARAAVHPPSPDAFDVICVSFYLERAIARDIASALKSEGLLFYQTFIHEKVTEQGPANPSYRLGPNELLELFSPLHVLAYRELGCVGDTGQGLRDTAWLVGQRR